MVKTSGCYQTACGFGHLEAAVEIEQSRTAVEDGAVQTPPDTPLNSCIKLATTAYQSLQVQSTRIGYMIANLYQIISNNQESKTSTTRIDRDDKHNNNRVDREKGEKDEKNHEDKDNCSCPENPSNTYYTASNFASSGFHHYCKNVGA